MGGMFNWKELRSEEGWKELTQNVWDADQQKLIREIVGHSRYLTAVRETPAPAWIQPTKTVHFKAIEFYVELLSVRLLNINGYTYTDDKFGVWGPNTSVNEIF